MKNNVYMCKIDICIQFQIPVKITLLEFTVKYYLFDGEYGTRYCRY